MTTHHPGKESLIGNRFVIGVVAANRLKRNIRQEATDAEQDHNDGEIFIDMAGTNMRFNNFDQPDAGEGNPDHRGGTRQNVLGEAFVGHASR